MKKISVFTFFMIVCCFNLAHSQIIEINGKVFGMSDLNNINVLNLSSKKNAITNEEGKFNIKVKENDTLMISSIQYRKVTVVIDSKTLLKKEINIELNEAIYELKEIVIGKSLTGILSIDAKNIKVKDNINFSDVGIPGYVGMPKTQNERRLYTATTGLDKYLNLISGRTKEIKSYIMIDKKKKILDHLKIKYLQAFSDENKIEADLRIGFLNFCGEDVNFLKRCQDDNINEIFDFFNEKLVQYNSNVRQIEPKYTSKK